MKNIFNFALSSITLKRLADYLCQLLQLPPQKFQHISSSQLAKIMGGKPSQLRQDFHHFGGFGQPGHPYEAPMLIEELKRIFGLEGTINLLVCGADNMTKVIIKDDSLRNLQIIVRGVFDFDSKQKGKDCSGYKVMTVKEAVDFQKVNPAQIGVICSGEAEKAVEFFSATGIKFIWNLSQKNVIAPKGVTLHQENLVAGLLTLIYKMNSR